MVKVNIIGAGLAGCEAAYQLLKRGVEVNLYDIKPNKFTEAHKNPNFAELVCSNSLKSLDSSNAKGLLKQELLMLDSLLLKCAYETRVDAGGALAVDREKFAALVTKKLKEFNNLNFISEEVEKIDTNIPTIIATGPLTTNKLLNGLKLVIENDSLYFFDAMSPIVSFDSLDKENYFIQDRYQKGNNDYINCPMTKQEYDLFYNELINAESVELKDFENKKVFEGCMPVEVMAKRGEKALLFGPLKPVGLIDPKTDKRPYAVVQLRKENNTGNMYNLVGFQTNLKFLEQKRVFSLIPALKNADFIRYGEMHKNTFINAPNNLNETYQLKKYPNIFIAGQFSGVEGYVESISSGLYAGINMYRHINNMEPLILPNFTAVGGLSYYIVNSDPKHFQPMNMNFGVIMSNIGLQKCKNKLELVENSLNYIKSIKNAV
ncbi:MAG: methylenetetrahydrofolate--tRNA-(uracil(54)-C(5))-methyltransferase (FADH(2)-oxidizing) TrmFO [Clostridiales bacterium]|nr:methylenetetrahydrofolate--tRNA-(uracil(54)-C(5))-methyltransferase (FADH(2)-oxidizing) TrmFO [Clostridiales bacterium]